MFCVNYRNVRSLVSFVSHCRKFNKISPVAEILSTQGKSIPSEELLTVKGWVKNLRVQKKNVFIDISDGSCNEKLQVYLTRNEMPNNLTWGSSVEVIGTVGKTPRGQTEIAAKSVVVIGTCDVTDGYPLVPGQSHSPEYLRQYLHLRPRTNSHAALLRVRDAAVKGIYKYFDSLGFINIHVPVLTSNDCEGAGEVFRVEPENDLTVKEMHREGKTREQVYFGSKTFLTVSGQLHLEAAAHSLSKVFSFSPTFRAENSKSRLHLSEFYMLEAEEAFVSDINIVMSLVQDLLKSVTRDVLTKCEADILSLREQECKFDWLDMSFCKIKYDEAIQMLGKEGEEGLNKEDELKLVEMIGVPTFVTHWPASLKPFYMRNCKDEPDKVDAVDLLVPIVGEVAGGSLRENDYEKLKAKLPTSELNWYLELRKFGGVPTGGFGLGFERYLQFICGILNIKDTIPFPRWPHNCSL